MLLPRPCAEINRRKGRSILLAIGLAMAMPRVLLAQPDRLIDLAALTPEKKLITRILGAGGESRSGRFGLPVAGALDSDGDGLSDFAVSYMTASPFGRQGSGEAYLIFGGAVRGEQVDSSEPRADVLRIIGDADFENTGSEVWMGDVTGDGLGDLLLCRQNLGLPDRRAAGGVTILIGGLFFREMARNLQVLDLRQPPPGAPLLTLVGERAGDRLGIWLRVGDVDGDRIDDIVVGADQVDAFIGESHSGSVYVVRGGGHLALPGIGDLAQLDGAPLAGSVLRVVPPVGSGEFHYGATCQVADLDGDGRAEVIASAALNRSGATLGPSGPFSSHGVGGPERGRLYITWSEAFSAPPWPNGLEIRISPGNSTIISGGALNGSFGEEILGGLDYDGDGDADLFVGDLVANGEMGLLRVRAGAGYVFFNAALLKGREFDLDSVAEDVRLTRILGPSVGAIGSDTAGDGDFDGDGYADLMVGSPLAAPLDRNDAGLMHILHGGPVPWPQFVDLSPEGFPDQEVMRITEILGARGDAFSDGGDVLCYSAAVGDVDGDGLPDIITNEMTGNGLSPEAVDVGNLVILDGSLLVPGRGDPSKRPLRILPGRFRFR